MGKTLLIAFRDQEISALSAFADQLPQDYDVIVVSGESRGTFGAKSTLTLGMTDVPTADSVAESLGGLCKGYTHIAGLATMEGKDLFGRLAGLLGAAMVTDVTKVLSPSQFMRPMMAGTVFATVETLTEPVVLTVRGSSFPQGHQIQSTNSASTEISLAAGSVRISSTARGGTRPDLSQAKVIVSGGRPLRDAETFEKVIGGLADALQGAVGATRAAVDAGIAPNELQVGQTGKIVAPDLYIAAGISGSTQHMAGIKDSKVIVAINKDPDAPIFEIADYGLVADLFEAVPDFQKQIDV